MPNRSSARENSAPIESSYTPGRMRMRSARLRARQILAAHREAARLARKIGLGVNAGHDLDLKNIPAYVKAVKGLQEVSIGHALISDALYMGLTRTVKAYLKALGSKPLNVKGAKRK